MDVPTWTNFDSRINKTFGKNFEQVVWSIAMVVKSFKNSVFELAKSVCFHLISP